MGGAVSGAAEAGPGLMWYRLGGDGTARGGVGDDAPGGASSEPCFLCQAFNASKKRERSKKVGATPAKNNSESNSPTLKAAERVRIRARETIERGGIVYWEDAAEWLREEKRKDVLKGGCGWIWTEITVVINMFKSLAEEIDSKAREVNSKGGIATGIDGRQVLIALFPVVLRDEIASTSRGFPCETCQGRGRSG